MMKGLLIHKQNLALAEENMSNLTSASCEASVSSNQQQSSYASPDPNPNPIKKKRSLPGNPDPDAEVIALSPKSLLATNRFLCEICNKGFQRDQNLQLHRRGHNLPWKLKQRTSKEVRKKVYVCPEAACVQHDPSRALGDLNGIKKHFCRKHGEKKWKCDKCAKKYAVQSDWKAHSKTCGTREYRCDCGTLFSRRDSFITHRAFCDALAEESARIITANPLAAHHHPLFSPAPAAPPVFDPHQSFDDPHFDSANMSSFSSHGLLLQELSLKTEATEQQQQLMMMMNMRPAAGDDVPQWLTAPPSTSMNPMAAAGITSSSLFSARLGGGGGGVGHDMSQHDSPSSSPLPLPPPPPPPYQATAPASPHMSATALLQKAARMGATMSRPSASSCHTSAAGLSSTTAPGFGLGLSSSSSQDHMAAAARFSFSHAAAAATEPPNPSLLHGMMMPSMAPVLLPGGGGGDGAADGQLTRDFLSLRAISRGEILSMTAGLDSCMSSPAAYSDQQG